MDRTQDTTLSGVDRDRLHQAAEMLLEARRTVQPIDDLPPGLAPRTHGRGLLRAGSDAPGHREGWRVEGRCDEPGRHTLLCPYARGRLRDKRGADCEAIPQVAGRRSGDCLPDGQGSAATRDSVLAGRTGRCYRQLSSRRSSCWNLACLTRTAVDRLTAIADLQSNGGFISGSPV